jgi:hypothetical protein
MRERFRLAEFLMLFDAARVPEAEDLVKFVSNLRRINSNAEVYARLNPLDACEYLMTRAAIAALRAHLWRDKIATTLGWQPTRYSRERLGVLYDTATLGSHRMDAKELDAVFDELVPGADTGRPL